MPPYGMIFIVGYMLVIPLQNWIFRKKKTWNLGYELSIIGLMYSFAMFGVYFYYKSDIVNGDYSFSRFLLEIYLPTLVILSTIIFFGRWFIARKKEKIIVEKAAVQSDKIMLKGDNKSDVIQVLPGDLICISSAQNYVEINYLHNGALQKKLLRTTLKKISQQVPNLIQVHRSHFVNPQHFVAWSTANSIILYQLTIPVSQNYKKTLLDCI